ncbi:MAG TPA: agmatinase [Longimicrobiales bacterium]|nr:agmatinase [Longimicrobiales bacterium]
MRMPESLRSLEWELPHSFMGLDEEASDLGNAKVVILPVPYEATTSFGGGTGNGPAAIIDASRYIELYDQELDGEPADVGIATLPSLMLTGAGPQEAIAELRAAYDRVLDAAPGRFVITLGGEHSISSAPILAWADRLQEEGRRLTVLQFDAHTDLRPEYEGSEYSHASVMSRTQDRVEIVAVGIRAITSDEMRLVRKSDNIHVFLADDIHTGEEWMDDVMSRLGEDVYITFDVDGFDPSLVPSTGTPEPGGLQWYPVMKLLRRVFAERTVHAVDIVELAPIAGLSAPDFLVAKLAYKMIGYRFADGAAGSERRDE